MSIQTSHHTGGGAYLLLDGSRAMTGDLDLADNDLLTTNFAIYELSSSILVLRNRGKTLQRSLLVSQLFPSAGVNFFYNVGEAVITTRSVNDRSIRFDVMENGVGVVPVIRLKDGDVRLHNLPAADPADGTDTLWKKTVAGEDFLMVGT